MLWLRAASGEAISLERIDSRTASSDRVDGVLVIWTASCPSGADGGKSEGTRIVGWYRNATVLRFGAKHSNEKGRSYFIKAKKADCTLLPESQRVKGVPRQRQGFMGRSNIWYADAPEAREYVQEVLRYVREYRPTSRGGKRSRGVVDVEHCIRVEETAMGEAERYYSSIGYEVKRVERENKGWDLEVRSGRTRYHVEVKGLSGAEISVQLTPNEYKRMKENEGGRYRLFVVTNALDEARRTCTIFLESDDEVWVSETDQSVRLKLKETISAVASTE